jgi:hypothetical protein
MREKDIYAIASNKEELRATLTPQYTWYEKLFSPFAKLKVRLEEKREKKKLQRQHAKKGYAECDVWEMRTWFINTAKPMLFEMYDKTYNHPEELEFEEWRDILKRMAHLLELMDVWSDEALRKELDISEDEKDDSVRERISEMRMKAKDEFFSLFNKYFYHLWY